MSPSILFVDMSEAFLPLIQGVSDQGVYPLLIGSTTQRVAEMGIPCTDLLAFDTPELRIRVEQARLHIAEGLGGAMKLPAIQAFFNGSRGCFLSHTGESFFKKFMETCTGQIVVLECFETLLRQHRPSLIVLRTEKEPYERALISRARQLGIPTLHLAHAIWEKTKVRIAGEYTTGLSSDYIAVFGERASKLMREMGTAPDRIFVTGSPYWDHLYAPENQIERDTACRQLGLDPHLPVVMFCTGYANAASAFYASSVHHSLRAHEAVIDSLRQLGQDVQLIIRPHPTEIGRIPNGAQDMNRLIESYQRWINSKGISRILFSLGSKVEVTRAAQAVIIYGISGVITETMILQRPVILTHSGPVYGREDGIFVADHLKDLSGIVKEVVCDPGRQEEMIRKQNEALPDINYGNDGRALERITDLVLRLARPSARSGRAAAASLPEQASAPSPEPPQPPKTMPITKADSTGPSHTARMESQFSDELQTGLLPTRRAVIDINRSCNARCVMCYYAFEPSNLTLPFSQVQQELLAARARGNTSVDFTGGEPTLYPEMEEATRFAESIGLQTCIITNGLALERIKRLAEAGCREWLLSIHGFEENHDLILGVKGAWDKINRTVEYLNLNGCRIRVNCTITKQNMKDLPRLAAHYLRYVNPRMVNFINFNPHYQWGDQMKSEICEKLNRVQAKASETAPYLKVALDLLRRYYLWANVRYFPFCLLQGYETHICNNPQVMFDPFEWDYGAFPKTGANYLSYARRLQAEINTSDGACSRCGIMDVCGGLHKNYARRHGDGELLPYTEQSDYPYHFKQDVEADIVVPVFRPDRGSTNVIQSICQTAASPYNLIVVTRQQSAAKNRNYGMVRSQSPYVIMCDDDIADMPPAWNRFLVDILKENRELLAVSARLMRPDGTPGPNAANNYDLSRPLVEVNTIPSACCVFRNTEVRFDERYIRAGYEDTDFFVQLQNRHGGRFAIANSIKVVHLNEEKNLGGAGNQFNLELFCRKWDHKMD